MYHMLMSAASTHNRKGHKQPSGEDDSASQLSSDRYTFGNPQHHWYMSTVMVTRMEVLEEWACSKVGAPTCQV